MTDPDLIEENEDHDKWTQIDDGDWIDETYTGVLSDQL